MRHLLLTTTLATLILGTLPAHAWRTIDPARIWAMEDMPVLWYAPSPETADVVSMPEGEALELLDDAMRHWWEDVPCSPVRAEYGGEIPNEGQYVQDNRTSIYFEDPESRLGSGILGACLTWWSNDTLHYNGMDFFQVTDFDIIFNDGVNYGTPDDIYGGGCTAQTSFEGVATHEIGHGFGLGHSCEDEEACPDPTLRNAVMNWAIGSCETGRETPNEDDIAGMNALYGVYTDFEATADTSGGVPLEVSFDVPEELSGDIETYYWNFGDGGDPSTDASPTHTYADEGQYTVTLTVTGTNDECGEFEDSARKVGYVLACGLPQPEFDVTSLGDGVVQFNNNTPTATFGCIHEYTWDLGDGTEVSGYEPQHDYGLDGSWTVTLTATGPGGSDAIKHEIEVRLRADPRDDEPSLCAVTAEPTRAGAGSVLFATIALLGLAFLRRQR